MIKFDWTITSKESLLKLKLGELKKYRHLFFQLVYRDLIATYKQTILGPAWLIIHPIITTFIFTLVFGKIIKISTEGLPQPLFFLSGIICWNYFSECFSRTSTVFKDNTNVFGKIYFPRIIVPICLSISMFVRFLIHLILLSIVMIMYRNHPFHYSFFKVISILPLLVLMMAMLGVGFGLIVACLTIKYRDLNFVIAFGLQLTMYTTTVIFPLSSAPINFKNFVQVNPMTAVIEAFRYALFDSGSFSVASILSSLIFSILIFSIGFLIFNRVERTFIDNI